jgi:hypothetical protein
VSYSAQTSLCQHAYAVDVEHLVFKLKSRVPSSEWTMNIFYIIGVVVVVIIVAGYLGVHL